MRASRVVLAVLAAVCAVGILSCDNPTVVERQLTLAWIVAPPENLREGDSATVTVELHDASGQPVADFDGATVELRFAFQSGDSLPGTACGAACTAVVAQGRARLTVGWMSAGTWAASACVRSPTGTDTLCAQHAVEVLAVRPVLVTYPADSVGRRVRFPVEAQLRLPNGTAVTDQARTVRLRFTSAAPAASHVQCPEAGPLCERAAVAGVVRLDSVLVLDTAATTLEACAIAPNGHERCDPAGPRTFRVVVPRLTLHFATEPSGGSAGVPFTTQPVIEALEPDGTRRTDFTGPVDLALGASALAGPVLAGTGAGGATERGTVTVRAAAGVATLTDLRVNRVGAAYALVASAAGAVADTSAAFNVSLDAARLGMAKVAGDSQRTLVGFPVPIVPSVLVTGPLGDPVAGVLVAFLHPDWGRVTDSLDITDSSGVAAPGAWTLDQAGTAYPGARGDNLLTANIAGGAQVTFFAEAVFGAHVDIVNFPTTITAGDTIRPAITAEFQDDQGRWIPGMTGTVTLHFSMVILNGFGDQVPADTMFRGTFIRNAGNGRAAFDDISATHAGYMVVRAVSPLSDWYVDHPFTVLPGATDHLAVLSGDGQRATAGTSVPDPVVVRAEDRLANPAPGRTVTFTVTMGGGSVTDSVRTTDADGLARPGSWTLGPVPGVNMLSAKADGIADSVVFFATGTAPSFNASSVSAGFDFTCATALTTNLPYCWGANTYSQLGEGTQTARSRPTQLAGGLLQLTQVSAGTGFACGLATNGAAYCWGSNNWGQLGIDTADVNQHATPNLVVGGHTFQQISVGFAHVCALDTDGAVWCWGAFSEGNLGVATADRFSRPLHVASVLRFTQVDVGGNTSCALAESGDIWCWGYNGYGGVGNNSTDARLYVPVRVAGGRSYTQVSVGTYHTCGVSLGAVYCWGRNQQGQLGTGSTTPAAMLEPVPALGALGMTMRVAAGTTHTCALNSQGETYCWGTNANGELGDGTTTTRLTGVPTSGGVLFVAITAGLNHTCGLRQNGATYCWGLNGSGRLGDGTLTQRTVPTQVAVP